MKIAEIEPYIDSLQLKKLEVKLEQGREVRMFICADNVTEYSERVYGDIVVFDREGHAWKLDQSMLAERKRYRCQEDGRHRRRSILHPQS